MGMVLQGGLHLYHDLIEGILGVIRYHKGFEVYNLGESQTTSLMELIKLIEGAFGKKANIEMLEPQPGDVSIPMRILPKPSEC